MLEEECRKRPESDSETDVTAGKKPRYEFTDEEEDEAELPIGEETIAEVMKWLEEELVSTTTTATTTLPCNEAIKESCGASFSDQSSTVMASIDVSGLASNNIAYFMQHQSLYFFYPPPQPQPSYDSNNSSSNVNLFGQETEVSNGISDENVINVNVSVNVNGCDVEESDDDNWLEMCLNADACPLDFVD